MTSQEEDLDEVLDFDCFFMTGFFMACSETIIRSTSSNFNGRREIGLDRSGVRLFIV